MYRGFLYVREACFLLQLPEMKVRRLIEAGELTLLGTATDGGGRRKIRIDPESVRKRFPADSTYDLRRRTMTKILAGHLRVPKPLARWGQPAPLIAADDQAAQHSCS